MRWAICSLAALVCASARGFTMFDSEFNDWTGSFSEHRFSGGNPGAYLHWEGNIGGTPGSFVLSRPDFVYNPGASGAISNLNVALDAFRIQEGTPSYSIGIAATQSGQTYFASLNIGASATWLHYQRQNLTASDFNIYFFGSGNPNFSSSGAPIAFGIFVGFISEGYPVTGGFDNYLVTTEAVPEPTTIAALGLGGLTLLKRRRKP